MKNPKSKTLFHFTDNRDAFYSILKNGLKFAYCEEHFNDKFHYALPMICFCDMPLTMIEEHTINYGSYGIGFNKDRMIRNYWKLLNPVNYIFSANLINGAERFLEIVQKEYDINDEASKQLYRYATNQLAFMKPYYGTREKRVLYNESEWRMIIPDRSEIEGYEPTNWFWKESEYIKFKNKYKNKITKTNLPFFKFTPEEVQFILVKNSTSRYPITRMIMDMKKFGGNKIELYQKQELLSKMIFLDEIKSNF